LHVIIVLGFKFLYLWIWTKLTGKPLGIYQMHMIFQMKWKSILGVLSVLYVVISDVSMAFDVECYIYSNNWCLLFLLMSYSLLTSGVPFRGVWQM
jgi:hypothetical protein